MKTLENENIKTLEEVPPEIGGLQLISRKTAAKLIDCNPTFIDKLIQSGKLTSVRLGEPNQFSLDPCAFCARNPLPMGNTLAVVALNQF
jgi:hypothetical protein